MKKIPLLLGVLLLFGQLLVAQTDTIPPILVCKQIAYIGLFNCNLTLSANDFIAELSDDLTPLDQLQVGIRKSCVGSGFPENHDHLMYSGGNDLGAQTVELWARDLVGNTSTCSTTFDMTEAGWNCEPGMIGWAYSPENEWMDSVTFIAKGQNCMADSFDFEGITTDLFTPTPICHFWDVPARPGYDFSVTPSRNFDPLNGVTTYDLSLIAKHILGISPLDDPYKIIAADANQDGKVTTVDLVMLRRLILGLIDELPQGKSWRFIPYGYVFSNPQNPFVPAFPEKITVVNTQDPAVTGFTFKAVKIGDVDFSADPK